MLYGKIFQNLTDYTNIVKNNYHTYIT